MKKHSQFLLVVGIMGLSLSIGSRLIDYQQKERSLEPVSKTTFPPISTLDGSERSIVAHRRASEDPFSEKNQEAKFIFGIQEATPEKPRKLKDGRCLSSSSITKRKRSVIKTTILHLKSICL